MYNIIVKLPSSALSYRSIPSALTIAIIATTISEEHAFEPYVVRIYIEWPRYDRRGLAIICRKHPRDNTNETDRFWSDGTIGTFIGPYKRINQSSLSPPTGCLVRLMCVYLRRVKRNVVRSRSMAKSVFEIVSDIRESAGVPFFRVHVLRAEQLRRYFVSKHASIPNSVRE